MRLAYEDEHLVVVDKPAGITVHPGAGAVRLARSPRSCSASARPAATIPTVRASSIASTATRRGCSSSRARRQAFVALQEAIRQREVERRYLALVRGQPRSRTGRIDAPIGRDRRDPTRRSLDTEEPRDAVTWFELVEVMSEHALLDVRLEIGPDAPDPRPPRGDRSPGLRGRDLRREGRPRPRAAVPARASASLRPSGHAGGARSRVALAARSRRRRSRTARGS